MGRVILSFNSNSVIYPGMLRFNLEFGDSYVYYNRGEDPLYPNQMPALVEDGWTDYIPVHIYGGGFGSWDVPETIEIEFKLVSKGSFNPFPIGYTMSEMYVLSGMDVKLQLPISMTPSLSQVDHWEMVILGEPAEKILYRICSAGLGEYYDSKSYDKRKRVHMYIDDFWPILAYPAITINKFERELIGASLITGSYTYLDDQYPDAFPDGALMEVRYDGYESGADPSSFKLQFRKRTHDRQPVPDIEYSIEPLSSGRGSIKFFPIKDYLYIDIVGSYTEKYATMIRTTGLTGYAVYVNGSLYGTYSGDILLSVADGVLVEMLNLRVDPAYDENTFLVSFYRAGEVAPWFTTSLNIGGGVSFPAGYEHSVVEIIGQKKQPVDPIDIYIRKSPSIESAVVITEEGQQTLTSEENHFEVHAGTDVIFNSIDIASGFNRPYILRFYKDHDYEPDNINFTVKFPNSMPSYNVVDGTYYAEIGASISYFLWYSSDIEDRLYIKKGNLFSENFTAQMWNDFREKLSNVASLYGINYYFTLVSPNTIFYGTGISGTARSDFSDVVNTIALLPGSNMYIGAKGKGATVYASYFQNTGVDFHGNSIKKALNDVIANYNGPDE